MGAICGTSEQTNSGKEDSTLTCKKINMRIGNLQARFVAQHAFTYNFPTSTEVTITSVPEGIFVFVLCDSSPY